MRLLSILALIFVLLLLFLTRDGISQFVQTMIQGQQAGQGNGPGQGRSVPPISDRYFGDGSVATTVTGDLQFTGNLELDTLRSYAQDGLGWIDFAAGDAEVLIALHEPENSVTIVDGDLRATGVDAECAFNIEVTTALISGSVSCVDIGVFRNDERTGTATIEVQFTAETDAESPGDPAGE